MEWLDDLREEVNRSQAERPTYPARREGQSAEPANDGTADAARLVRTLLDQLNRQILEGRGSVWESQARWGAGLWELWWGGSSSRTAGHHIVVAILLDSRGTPYLKVQRRRLAVNDPLLARRLQLALRAAFLQGS